MGPDAEQWYSSKEYLKLQEEASKKDDDEDAKLTDVDPKGYDIMKTAMKDTDEKAFQVASMVVKHNSDC
jgi:hypothetical protein